MWRSGCVRRSIVCSAPDRVHRGGHGRWGEKVRKAFADMGAIEFAEVDSGAQLEQDARVAAEFDAGVFVPKSLG